jgi:hypothetical protein
VAADKIPPVENHQNHAQKTAVGDTGDIGDILPMSMGGQLEKGKR